MPNGSLSYFVRLEGGRFHPTELTGGAWSTSEQHIAPLLGLLAHEIERSPLSGAGKVLGRLSCDILGVVGLEEFEIRVEVLRPGRTIELVEAVALVGDRAVVRARAWRLTTHDTTDAAGGAPAALPGPETATPWAMTELWPGGFIASLDVRTLIAPTPGRATTWVRAGAVLVADEPIGELARWLALVDTANGVGVRRSPREWMYPNLDLTVHLHRQPRGPWLGLDTEVVFGESGQGLTSAVLHDLDGPVGRAEQTLTVRRL